MSAPPCGATPTTPSSCVLVPCSTPFPHETHQVVRRPRRLAACCCCMVAGTRQLRPAAFLCACNTVVKKCSVSGRLLSRQWEPGLGLLSCISERCGSRVPSRLTGAGCRDCGGVRGHLRVWPPILHPPGAARTADSTFTPTDGYTNFLCTLSCRLPLLLLHLTQLRLSRRTSCLPPWWSRENAILLLPSLDRHASCRPWYCQPVSR